MATPKEIFQKEAREPLNTILFYAAQTGQTEIIQTLIGLGADVNAKNIFGATPLHEAVRNGQNETVQALIGKGADINVRDSGGRTAFDWAQHFSAA